MQTGKESKANIMNITTFDNMDACQRMRQKYEECIRRYPKMRYRLKFIAGDPYYEEMSVEEAIEKTFIGPESEEKRLTSQQ
jgi:hypothetical protein